MKTKSIRVVFLLLIVPASLFAQEKTGKEQKEAQKLELQKQVESLLNSKNFVFVGGMAYPQGGRSINLTTRPNFVKYGTELIECDMPFFGRVYSGGGYGGSDAGLNFSGKPDEFTITAKKKGFLVVVAVKGLGDSYKLTMDAGNDGHAMLSISSNTRSTISYSGVIMPPDRPEDKK